MYDRNDFKVVYCFGIFGELNRFMLEKIFFIKCFFFLSGSDVQVLIIMFKSRVNIIIFKSDRI